MIVPIRWLRDYVEIEVPAEEIAARLNDSGVEVDSVSSVGSAWERDKILVGRVVRIDAHPNAERLTLPVIDIGEAEHQVVCGASNFGVGDKVPFALEGALLVDSRKRDGTLMTLKAATIRGVESRGMVCSPLELGLSDDHEGLLVLPEDAPVGAPLVDFMGGDVIELDLKPNRADCLAVLGVARQVAALFEAPLRELDTGAARDDRSMLPELKIEIVDPDLCARYSAAYLYDIRVEPAPEWMRSRLERAGIRSVNNIVDITNFVMLEIGQPLHAFDWTRLRGNHIGVRSAVAGETLATLDGKDRILTPENLLIVDAEGPVGLAGVMGGIASEVTDGTSEILLESANFDQISIRRTSRGLGLRSEASRRFEQRLSPETTVVALRRAVGLAVEIGAAKGVDLWEDSYPRPHSPVQIDFPLSEIRRLLGVEYPPGQVTDALSRAGFGVEKTGDGVVRVTPPFWRGDVTMDADVVEEVVSIIGFDTIPSTLPTGTVTDEIPWEIDPREDKLRDVLVGAGFQEAITYTATSVDRMRKLLVGAPDPPDMDALGREVAERLLAVHIDPIELVNPLRSEQNVMRTTALTPMLETLSANLRFHDRDVALFEIGPIFVPRDGDLPEERRVLTVVSGARTSDTGWNRTGEVDFFGIKGVAELALDRLGIEGARYEPFIHPAFRTGRNAAISIGDAVIGAIGEVSPEARSAYDIDETAWAVALDLSRAFERARDVKRYEPVPRFPAIVQDLSITVDVASRSLDLVQSINEVGGDLVTDVILVDEYRGEQVLAGKRGLTYSITYRAADRTLVDSEAAECHARIIRALEARYGVELRS